MSDHRSGDARRAALDSFLDERCAAGYSVETRSTAQAVIVRRQRLHYLLQWFSRGDGRRLVVSVDQNGEITTVAAEPRRW
ncbi:MAG TPA: hypothetical protein VLK36_02320 [Gaiellaceae bacterium]|nr:hypothetical protein [Gaiellaceae bacterium]